MKILPLTLTLPIVLVLVLVLLNGCASQGVDRNDQNTITKEFYASIDSIKQVELSSYVKSGIAGGAIVGVADELGGTQEDMIAGGIAGALVGGLFTAFLEGSDTAYQYSLNSKREGNFTLIQKELIDIKTGCAKIRVSGNTSLSAASKENCHVE